MWCDRIKINIYLIWNKYVHSVGIQIDIIASVELVLLASLLIEMMLESCM